MAHPIMTIHMVNQKKITIELYPEKAPNSVNGLLWALERHLFDQMAIARIVPGFVLQPWYDENIMPLDYQYLISGEFKANGFHKNDLIMHKYAVGLAGDGSSVSSPGCFFIVVGDGCEAALDEKFAGVGYVIAGFEEVDRLVSVPLKPVDSKMAGVLINEPLEAEVIETITYDLNGYEPLEPIQFLPESFLNM